MSQGARLQLDGCRVALRCARFEYVGGEIRAENLGGFKCIELKL